MINTTNTLISMWVALCCTNTHRHTHTDTHTRTQPARLWAGLVGQCHFRAKQASFRKVKHSRRLWQQKWSPVGLSAWSATLCGLGRWKLQIIVHLFWWKKTRLSLPLPRLLFAALWFMTNFSTKTCSSQWPNSKPLYTHCHLTTKCHSISSYTCSCWVPLFWRGKVWISIAKLQDALYTQPEHGRSCHHGNW